MPGWQDISWGGFKIYAKPISWWRKRWLQLLPYRYGSKPTFKLVFERLSNTTPNQQIEWFIKFSNGDTTGHVINIPQMNPGQIYESDAGGRLLGYTGDTVLGVYTNKPVYHTLYSFRVLAVEDMLGDILLAIAVALLGFLLSRV